jgi:hypothetical protein
VVACASLLISPLIFIEHTNDIRSRRSIRTLIQLISNLLRVLIKIIMITSSVHRNTGESKAVAKEPPVSVEKASTNTREAHLRGVGVAQVREERGGGDF